MKMNWKKLLLSCVVFAAPTVMAQDPARSGQAVPMDEVVLVNKTTVETTGGSDDDCNVIGGFIIGNGCSIVANIEGNVLNDNIFNDNVSN